jgi:hypothetical protein
MRSRKKKAGLSAQTRDKLIAAYDEELRAAGLGTFDGFRQLLTEVSEPNTLNTALLAGIESVLSEMSEPSPKELQRILSALKGKLRYEIRPTMVKVAKEMKDKLPRKPGGGRGAALTPEERSKACDEVAGLMRKGASYKIALVRVGSRFGVSPRTIQRAWQKRRDDSQEWAGGDPSRKI